MKNKIAKKLIIYFSFILLLFAIIIGSLFAAMFMKHTVYLHKRNMTERAQQISDKLSQFFSNQNYAVNHCHMHKHENNFELNNYLNYLDDIAMGEVWIIDNNLEFLAEGHHNSVTYSKLPPDGEKVINEALKGEIAFGNGFSEVLGIRSLTVGVPVYDENNEITAAVLLHSSIAGISDAFFDGIQILIICLFAAFLLSVAASVFLSLSFIKPLKKMNETACHLIDMDYTAKTDVKQNDEIGELAASIDILSNRLFEASKESEKLENMRRDFISNISHELRTPVTVIRGSLEAICDGVVNKSEQVEEYHKQMLNESIYLQRLVNDLLDLSRLQNMDFEIIKEHLNLFSIIDDVIRSMNGIAKEKNINLKFNSNVDEADIWGDYGRLRQMFMIIIDNALKFSNDNGTVSINMVNNNDRLTISIQDNGCGIKKEILPYIFERFFKSNSESNKNGTGLGLAIAKQIADRHGIDLTVQSELNKGTKFSFEF